MIKSVKNGIQQIKNTLVIKPKVFTALFDVLTEVVDIFVLLCRVPATLAISCTCAPCFRATLKIIPYAASINKLGMMNAITMYVITVAFA